ncbi:MAG TPA: DUF58 domain-containing protein [Candidatus Binataceae bacterium]|nr:DUF58 domain-containing protein [Candidatus Binataceae bacterium]
MIEERAFEPDFLRRLDRLVLAIKRARTVRAGQRTIGREQGRGIEIENFREYSEGDDLRFLDWNTYARLDNLTMRTYRAERQVEITMMIDASASMRVPGRDDKFGLARALACALAYIAMAENDSVRLVAFNAAPGGARIIASPFYRRREQFLELRPFVRGLECSGPTGLGAAVHELLQQRRPRGLVVVIGDFLVSQPEFEDAIATLLAAGNEVRAIHVMGAIESSGDYAPGIYRVRDAETGELAEVVFGPELAASCRRKVDELVARIRDFCSRRGVVYSQAFGARNLDSILEGELPKLAMVR